MFPVNDDAAKVMQESLFRNKKRIRDRFVKFHLENPDVYVRIVGIARQMKQRGVVKMGISLIYDRLRWLHFLETRGEEAFKLNDNYRSEYARLVMAQQSDLVGFFRIRSLRRIA